MLEKEKIVKEQRTAEAINKNLMGLEGKLGVILNYLGKPIVSQNSSNYNSTDWIDLYQDDEDEMPVYDPDMPITEIGQMFDGLKFGYHMEISYMFEGTIPVRMNEHLKPSEQYTKYEPASKVLKVNYKGYLVYLEADSDLHLYKPMDEWEEIVNKIYESAKKLRSKNKEINLIEEKLRIKEEKLTFLSRLRKTWGI